MASGPKTYPPIVLGFFARGLNTNRQPLFSALTGVGLQVIQFKDYLIDGINVECTDRFTLQRAPGFVKYCSQQLASSEKVNQFYDTRDLSGNVYTLADTNQHLYTVTPSALTSILTKGTTAQGYTQQIGGVTYYADGTNLKKWLPPASTMVPWGVFAPTTPATFTIPSGVEFWAPSLAVAGTNATLLDSSGNIEAAASFGTTNPMNVPSWASQPLATTFDGTVPWTNVGAMGSWQPSFAYVNSTVILDSNSNLQIVTVSGTSGATIPTWNATLGGNTTDSGVTWTNIGPGNILAFSGYSYVYAFRTITGNLSTASPVAATGPILTAPFNPITITAWSITSNVVTFTAANNLQGTGQLLEMSGFGGAATIFNGQIFSTTGATSSNFTASFFHANASGSDIGLGSFVVALLNGESTNNPECGAPNAVISSVQITDGIATITAPNSYSPGITIEFQSLTGATFLNGRTFSVSSATASSFTVDVDHANYGPTSQSGAAVFLAIEIYRTADGGGVYYFDGACENGGTWNFWDVARDSDLVTELVAPLAHQNDPPPIGATLVAWWSNRLWVAVGNKLYFSGGPDTLNGIPEECFPPGNVFVFPGVIASLNATTGGLVVIIPEEVWAIVGGPQTVSLYPERILTKFGALSANCVRQDGDTLYIYSSQKQLTVLSGAGKQELGAGGSGICPVGDLLANGTTTLSVTASAWSPTASYLTIHRQGEDSGIYVSNGIESMIRYGMNVGNFSPVRQPFINGGGAPAVAGAINSVETSAGQYSLLFGPTTTHDYIYARSLTTFTDNGHAYASNAVIGNIVVTEPGQPLAPLQFITAYLFNRGSVPTVSFLPNDITPSAFIGLSLNQQEPVFLAPPVNLIGRRWPVIMNQSATPILVRHLQVKMDFGNADTVKNELIELALRFDTEQMV